MACEKEAGSAPTGPQLKYSSSYSTLSPDVVEQGRSTYTSQPPPSMAHGLKEKLKENHGSLTSGYHGSKDELLRVLSDNRVFNFSPGPGVLFQDVLRQANNELMNWQGTGFSILEMSHRSPEFTGIINAARDNLRTLASVPDDYEIIFVQGGATQIFSSLCLNLSRPGQTVDYIVNGYWSEFAAREARRYCDVNIAAIDETCTTCPDRASWNLTPGAAYVHYCSNETIEGLEFQSVPDVGDVPLVCDMSSNFLSKPIDFSKFGMIYAGAHKNVGPAGLAIIIVQSKLLGLSRDETPFMLNYDELAKNDSMINTPPTFPIYFAGLVFQKLLHLGGLSVVEDVNRRKAKVLYDVIDNSGGYYSYKMQKEVRSLMNVPFSLPTLALEEKFLEEATAGRMVGLRGHKIAGHCRASIYNGMPTQGVMLLSLFLKDFQDRNPFVETEL